MLVTLTYLHRWHMQDDRLHMSFYGRYNNSPGHTSADTCFLEDWNQNRKSKKLLKQKWVKKISHNIKNYKRPRLCACINEMLHSQTWKGKSPDLWLPKLNEFVMSQSRHLFEVGKKILQSILEMSYCEGQTDRRTEGRKTQCLRPWWSQQQWYCVIKFQKI